MAYDEVFKYIGDIGRYQWMVYAVIFSCTLFIFDSLQMVFVGGDMNHWCHVNELVGLPYEVQKNVAIPSVPSRYDTLTVYSSCEMYALNYSRYNAMDFETWNRTERISNDTPVVKCNHWTYDQTTFQSTIVSKFNLVCGWNFLNQLVSSVYMAGVLFGSVTAGFISDRYGRKPAMFGFSSIKVIGIMMSIFGRSYTVFVLGRFLMGFGLCGYFIPAYVLVAELVGARYRTVLGCGLQMACAIGFMLQPAIAYALRDEFRYQLAGMGTNYILPVLTLFLIPESPRWLMLHGDHDKLLKLMNKICRVNGTRLSADFDPTSIKLTETVAVEQKNCAALVTSSVMRIRTLVIDFSWFTCSLMYYALSLNTGALHGNIYVNTFISGAVEVPAYITALLMMDSQRFGRRWTGCLSLVGAGLVSLLCIPMILTHCLVAATVFSMFGKAFISIAYAVVYVFAPEVFPTEVRNVAMGTASMLARIGSMAASYIGGPLAVVWKPLPSLVFGILATLSGLTYIFMPETLGQTLPDTIKEIETGNRHDLQHNIRLMETTDLQSELVDKVSYSKSPTDINTSSKSHAAPPSDTGDI